MPIIDQTGLTQNFHIDLKWEELGKQRDPDHDALKQALLDQLGLELVPSNMPVEMLVVEFCLRHCQPWRLTLSNPLPPFIGPWIITRPE
jgi:uncharacterized protein (TIGR03435 family)